MTLICGPAIVQGDYLSLPFRFIVATTTITAVTSNKGPAYISAMSVLTV